MGIAASQRFSRSRPCPICGGWDQEPRAQGVRCYGFLSDDGKFAYCTREDRAGGLPLKPNSDTYKHLLAGACRCGRQHGPDLKPRIVATYPYCDESGALLYEVVRVEPKTFHQRRPDGAGGWLWNLGDVRRVLYRLPGLLAEPRRAVFVVEGERDTDTLIGMGLLATTNAGGALKWRPEYAEPLAGRPIIILPDNDGPGRRHALMVAQSLHGVAASVRVVELPGLPPKGDVSDWLEL